MIGNVLQFNPITIIEKLLSPSGKIEQCLFLPLSPEPRQALLAGEQFLHSTLFEAALFNEQLFQGFDEGVGMEQRGSNGLLFSLSGWEGNYNFMEVIAVYARNTTLSAVCVKIDGAVR